MPDIQDLNIPALTLKAETLGVPDHLIPGLVCYVVQKRPTGSFLQCVLENDLKGAIERADDESVFALKKIVVFLYNYAPSGCWGSPKKVEAWLKG
jgi:hypothetical protein